MADDANGEHGDPLSAEGILKKRGNRTRKWKSIFAQIDGTNLRYGHSKESLAKSINLCSAVIEDLTETGKRNQFKIKAKDNNRTYYFNTSSEEEQQRWLQAIYIAKTSEKTAHQKSETCSLQ